MRVKIHYSKIIPTVSEVEFDEEKIIADFGYKEGLIDFFEMRESLSHHYKVKKENWEQCQKNLKKYQDTTPEEYMIENGTHIQTFERGRTDKIDKIELGRIDKDDVNIKTYSHGGFIKLVFKDKNEKS